MHSPTPPTIRMRIAGLAAVLLLAPAVLSASADPNAFPRKGRVALVELGADFCAPCRIMKPVLLKLQKAYADRADIVQVDVVEHHGALAKFGVRAIPTLIFFDEDGEEVKRHLGVLEEKAIIRQLERMGVPPPKALVTGGAGGAEPEG